MMNKEILIERAFNTLSNALSYYEYGNIKLFLKSYGEYNAIVELLEDYFDYEHDNRELNLIAIECGSLYCNIEV